MSTVDRILVKELRASFRGTLLRPGEEGYDKGVGRVFLVCPK